jgi:hypothetical protein
VTWRELTGIAFFLAGLLVRSSAPVRGGPLRAAGAVLFVLGFSFIAWERYRRGLGPPSTLKELKKEEFKDLDSVETDWICPHCHERNPNNFDTCWKCKHSKLVITASNNRSSGRDA